MARPKSAPKKQPLFPRTHTLSRNDDRVLQQLSQDASDALGWTVGSSAIIRALLQYVVQQPTAWASTALHPLIEQEIASGRVWGKKKL
jgi:phage gp46-like protein